MNILKYIGKILTIFLITLGAIYAGILYLRPDMSHKDLIEQKQFWIIPIALIFIIINFKSLFKSIINKVLLLSILSWGASQFFPKQAAYISSYITSKIPNSSLFKNTANEMMTPKDGSQPKFQFEDAKKQKNNTTPNQNNGQPTQPNSIEPKQKNTAVDIEAISKDPTKALGELEKMVPPEIQQKLDETGIDITNPVKTIENLGNKKPAPNLLK